MARLPSASRKHFLHDLPKPLDNVGFYWIINILKRFTAGHFIRGVWTDIKLNIGLADGRNLGRPSRSLEREEFPEEA